MPVKKTRKRKRKKRRSNVLGREKVGIRIWFRTRARTRVMVFSY
jgi:hypothetical protein